MLVYMLVADMLLLGACGLGLGAGERERESIETFHNGASPAHGLRITILTGLLDSLASIWQRLSPDSDKRLAGWYR